MILDKLDIFKKIEFLVGDVNFIDPKTIFPLRVFDKRVLLFLNDLSNFLLKSDDAKKFPEVYSFGFYCRMANLKNYENRIKSSENFNIGRGIALHFAPSNVPINFAYSLVSGLVTGNINCIRISNRNFDEVNYLIQCLNIILLNKKHSFLKKYINIIRYEYNEEITDYLSSICDIRIIWGGDDTISEIRKSKISPKAIDVPFANRYSGLIIEAENYLNEKDHMAISRKFFNDTYLYGNNSCTTPKLIFWIGIKKTINIAKQKFWTSFETYISERNFSESPIRGLNTFSSLSLAASDDVVQAINQNIDKNITRIEVKHKDLSEKLNHYCSDSNIFIESSSDKEDDILRYINKSFQTLLYIGFNAKTLAEKLVNKGILGVDRIVPVGQGADFDLIWDGYDLINTLTRNITTR